MKKVIFDTVAALATKSTPAGAGVYVSEQIPSDGTAVTEGFKILTMIIGLIPAIKSLFKRKQKAQNP